MKFALGSILVLLSLSAGLLLFGSGSPPLPLRSFQSETRLETNAVSTTPAVSAKVATVQAPKAVPPQAAPVVASSTLATTSASVAPESEISFSTQLEQEIHAQINVLRVQQGLGSLTWDPRLADIARAHSVDMLAQNYFDHTNKAGCTSSCRATNVGYAWRAIGENIYMMSGYSLSPAGTAEKVVTGWEGSPGHYGNMINDAYTFQGIGVAVAGDKIYVTELLAKPR